MEKGPLNRAGVGGGRSGAGALSATLGRGGANHTDVCEEILTPHSYVLNSQELPPSVRNDLLLDG